MTKTLTAGVARGIITPPKGVYLIGYGDRVKGNVGVHDDLTATALVLNQGENQVALVALDMLTINEFIVDRIRQQLGPMEVILCCSHTHAGPIAYADEKSPRQNQAYIDSLVATIVQTVQQAQEHLTPVRLAYSLGAGTVGINRRERQPDGRMEIGRNPEGPRDKSVQVVSVFKAHGRDPAERLATLVNYACHGTVLGPDNLLVSADWIGVMRAQVEQALGGQVLFLQGAAANINPDMYWEDAQAFERVAAQGAGVAQAVLAAVQAGAQTITTTPLAIQHTSAWLPTEAPVKSTKPPKNYGKPLLALAKLPGFLAVFADRLLDQRYPWKSVIEARNGYWSVPMRISAVRLGELALVTYAAETFTEIGLQVKANSPAQHTLFASVTDGCVSYLPTAEAHGEGGYEVEVAPLAYRYPGRLQPQSEQIALAATQKLLAGLWQVEQILAA